MSGFIAPLSLVWCICHAWFYSTIIIGLVHLSCLALCHHYDKFRTSVMSGFIPPFRLASYICHIWFYTTIMAGFVHLSYLALYHHYDRRRTSVMSGFLSRFTDQADPSMSWLFSYSPCTPFSEGFQDCVNVAVSLFIHGVQLLSYSKYTHSVRGLKSASVW